MSSGWRRRAGLFLIYGLILIGGHLAGLWIRENIQFDSSTGNQTILFITVLIGVLLYTILLAIPFVPGIEISIGLLAAFGRDVAAIIYFATIVSLTLSFVVGQLLPISVLAKVFRYFGFSRAEALVKKLAPLSSKARLALLLDAAPRYLIPILIKYRYVAIVVMLNVPGNAIVGGGGGIAMLAGISGLFSFVPFAITVAVAVIPVPLIAYLMTS